MIYVNLIVSGEPKITEWVMRSVSTITWKPALKGRNRTPFPSNTIKQTQKWSSYLLFRTSFFEKCCSQLQAHSEKASKRCVGASIEEVMVWWGLMKPFGSLAPSRMAEMRLEDRKYFFFSFSGRLVIFWRRGQDGCASQEGKNRSFIVELPFFVKY